MPTNIESSLTFIPAPSAITLALSEPDTSTNVWTLQVWGKIGEEFQRFGGPFTSIPPSVSGNPGQRVVALAAAQGISEWKITGTTPTNSQPGALLASGNPMPLGLGQVSPLTILEGTPVPSPPLPVPGAANIAYVATVANGGNDATGAVGNASKPFATFGAALAALLALPVAQRPPVLIAAGGTYLESVFVQAGAALNGLVMLADGEVTIDSTTLGDAFTIGAPSIADCAAFKSFTMAGKWVLRAAGTQALNVQGLPDPNGYTNMGDVAVGGLRFDNVVIRDGNINLKFLSMIVFNGCQTVNLATLADVENVSLLVLAGDSNLPGVKHTFNPTVSLDTLLPPIGLMVKAGSRVEAVESIGASKIAVDKGGAMGALNASAWAEFFSAVPPMYDAAPRLQMHGEAIGNHTLAVPAESAGAEHTRVSYGQGHYEGDLTASKAGGVDRVRLDLTQGSFGSLLSFTGLLDAMLEGAQYNPANLSTAGGATAAQSQQRLSLTTAAAGANPVTLSHAFPAGTAPNYGVTLTPLNAAAAADQAWVSARTDTDFEVTTVLGGGDYLCQVTYYPPVP